LRAHFTPSAIEEKADAIQITWQITVEREGGDKPACVAEWVLRYLVEGHRSSDHGP
jgi:hypothetical protein